MCISKHRWDVVHYCVEPKCTIKVQCCQHFVACPVHWHCRIEGIKLNLRSVHIRWGAALSCAVHSAWLIHHWQMHWRCTGGATSDKLHWWCRWSSPSGYTPGVSAVHKIEFQIKTLQAADQCRAQQYRADRSLILTILLLNFICLHSWQLIRSPLFWIHLLGRSSYQSFSCSFQEVIMD